MKNQYTTEQVRRIVANCVWNLRRAYAAKDEDEFRYQWGSFKGYFLAGFISPTAFHRGMLMGYGVLS